MSFLKAKARDASARYCEEMLAVGAGGALAQGTGVGCLHGALARGAGAGCLRRALAWGAGAGAGWDRDPRSDLTELHFLFTFSDYFVFAFSNLVRPTINAIPFLAPIFFLDGKFQKFLFYCWRDRKKIGLGN